MAKIQRSIEHVGSVSGLRDGIEEVLNHDIDVRVSDQAREAIRLVDDAKADLWGRAPTIRMDRSSNESGQAYRTLPRDPEYR